MMNDDHQNANKFPNPLQLLQSLDPLHFLSMSFIIWLIIISLRFSPFAQSLSNFSTDSLDGSLQEYAFTTLVRHRPHTGALYTALLPHNLSGLRASIVRLRSRTLWNVGANFSNIAIPPRTKTTPHVKRVAIVYQDFGNWSSQYYNVPGYSIITSVVGFTVFNASSNGNRDAKGIKQVSLNTRGSSIVIRFANLTSSGATRCVAFSANGTFQLREMREVNVCEFRDEGHFSVVAPLTVSNGGGGEQRKKQRRWYLWMIGFVLGFIAAAVVGYFSVVMLKQLMTKKIQVMERQADDDLVLETIWIRSSKMPSATVTRTQPTIESVAFS